MSRTARIQLDKHTRGQILAGKVTRIVRLPSRARFAPGDICPIMPESGPAVFRVYIIDALWTRLADAIPEGDVVTARELGARTSHDARTRFLLRHHRPFTRRDPDTIATTEINDVWERWSCRECWTLEVRPHTSLEERFMARSPHATAEKVVDDAGFRIHKTAADNLARGYTTDPRLAVTDEGACVDDVTLEKYAEEARAKHNERLGSLIGELRTELVSRADERDMFVIEQRLRNIEKRRAA